MTFLHRTHRNSSICAVLAAAALCGCADDAPVACDCAGDAGATVGAAPAASGWQPVATRRAQQEQLDQADKAQPTLNAARKDAVDQRTSLNETQSVTRVTMANVDLGVAPGVVFHVQRLHGVLRSTRPGRPPALDDKRSFLLDIEHAKVAVSCDALTTLLQLFVFGDPKSPIREVKVTVENGSLRLVGTLVQAGVPVAFSMLGPLEVSPSGRILFTPVEVLAAGVRVDALLAFLKVPMETVTSINAKRGVWLEGNSMVLDLEVIAPPPALRGTVTAIRVHQDLVVQVFGPEPAKAGPRAPDSRAVNHLFLEGGAVEVGRLLMRQTRLQLVDADPSDPLFLSMDGFHEQLEAATERIGRDDSLVVRFPDHDDL